MSFATVNTVCVYFDGCEDKVTPLEYAKFIGNQLGYTSDNILSMGVTVKNRLRLKLAREELVEEIYDKINKLKWYTIDERKYQLKIENESTRQTVKIHGVPFEMPETEVRRVLTAYGLVDDIKKEKWKGIGFDIYNEMVSVRMEIRTAIPSYVRIYGRLYWVTYFGQTRTCRRCNATTHEARECTFNATSVVRTRVEYATAAKGIDGTLFPSFSSNTQKFPELKRGNNNIVNVEKPRDTGKQEGTEQQTCEIEEEKTTLTEDETERDKYEKEKADSKLCSQHSVIHLNQQENKNCKLKRAKPTGNSSDEKIKPVSKRSNLNTKWADDTEDCDSFSSPELRTSELDFSSISQYDSSK